MRLILWACVVVMCASIAGAEEKPERWEGKVLRFRTQEEVDEHWRVRRSHVISKGRLWLDPGSYVVSKAKFNEPLAVEVQIAGNGGTAIVEVSGHEVWLKNVKDREVVSAVRKGRDVTFTYRGQTVVKTVGITHADRLRAISVTCEQREEKLIGVEAVKITGEPKK